MVLIPSDNIQQSLKLTIGNILLIMEKYYVICGSCNENLGEHRPFFAENHLKKYPDHDGFIIINEKKLSTPRMV